MQQGMKPMQTDTKDICVAEISTQEFEQEAQIIRFFWSSPFRDGSPPPRFSQPHILLI